MVREVRPLIEEGGRILNEAKGVIKGLDPDGHIAANAKHKTVAREATPEEYRLADLLKDLAGDVTQCIENAKRKLEDMPHAKKELNPLWGLLNEPLAQILAGVGMLLFGVLNLGECCPTYAPCPAMSRELTFFLFSSGQTLERAGVGRPRGWSLGNPGIEPCSRGVGPRVGQQELEGGRKEERRWPAGWRPGWLAGEGAGPPNCAFLRKTCTQQTAGKLFSLWATK